MGSWSTSSAGPELLADVQLGTCAASAVAWCPVNGLLAVGGRQHANLACVYVLSPYCLEHKVSLAVPLQGPEDDLVCVSWSPMGCRRVLLTVTKCGSVSAWTQLPPAHTAQQQDTQLSPFVALGDWWCQHVGQLIPTQQTAAAGQQLHGTQEQVVAVRWLQPSPRWLNSNRELQEQDFQAGCLPNMFAPPAAHHSCLPSQRNGPGQEHAAQPQDLGAFHWVQSGTMAFTSVLSSGTAMVGCATWGRRGQLNWQLTPGIALVPAAATAAAGPEAAASVLAADAAVSADGITVALAMQQAPGTVQLVALQGNPLHHQCLNAAARAQRPALQAHAITTCSMSAAAAAGPCRVHSLAWDPHSSGQRLVVATSSLNTPSSSVHGSGQLTLLQLTEQQQQLSQVGVSQVQHAPAPQQYAWLLDGLVAGQQLFASQTLAQLPASFPQLVAGAVGQDTSTGGGGNSSSSSQAADHLVALAASPHRVAVAMLLSEPAAGGTGSGSTRPSSRLLLYSLPPSSQQAAFKLAGRLVWSLLAQLHSWDLAQHLLTSASPQPTATAAVSQQAAAAAAADIVAAQSSRVAHVLSLVDRKLSAQPPELYTMYAARWDVLKYAVVSQMPGPEARAFSIDLRLRMMVPVLELQLTSAIREEEQRQVQQQTRAQQAQSGSAATSNAVAASAASSSQQQQQQQPAGSSVLPASVLTAVIEYAGALLEFELACINTWLHRRQAAAASGGNAAAAAAVLGVPCIRFQLDVRNSTKVTSMFVKAAEQLQLSKQGSTIWPFVLWKFLNKGADPPMNWEDMLPDVVPGGLQLHPHQSARTFPPCLLKLQLPADQLLRILAEAAPDWQQLPVLSDADITARATRLGLLPAKTLAAQDAFARQLRLHSGFRQQLPSTLLRPLEGPQPAAAAADDDNDAAQAAGASSKRGGPELSATGKRRRWQQQLADVIGSTAGPAAVAATEVFDLVHFAWGKPAVLGMHSVDGAVLVREAGQHQSGAAAPNAPDATGEGKAGARARKATSPVTNSWAYACPITGEMWLGPAGGRV